jgi:hypothetical protein
MARYVQWLQVLSWFYFAIFMTIIVTSSLKCPENSLAALEIAAAFSAALLLLCFSIVFCNPCSPTAFSLP